MNGAGDLLLETNDYSLDSIPSAPFTERRLNSKRVLT
jgi:hypothetical protein